MDATVHVRRGTLFQPLRHIKISRIATPMLRALFTIRSLSERALNNYLYARAVMGLEVSWPDVRPSATH